MLIQKLFCCHSKSTYLWLYWTLRRHWRLQRSMPWIWISKRRTMSATTIRNLLLFWLINILYRKMLWNTSVFPTSLNACWWIINVIHGLQNVSKTYMKHLYRFQNNWHIIIISFNFYYCFTWEIYHGPKDLTTLSLCKHVIILVG